MSWIEKLYKTYEVNAKHIGEPDGLVPPFHTMKNAQISVMIDESGNFFQASLIDKADQEKMIPCTESSAARTSGLSPHPLFDSLQYIAGDFLDLVKLDAVGDKKKEAKINNTIAKANPLYLEALGRWCESPERSLPVCIVYRYLRKKTLLRDLLSAGIIPVDTAGNACFLKSQTKQGESKNSLFSLLQGELSGAFVVFKLFQKDGPSINLCENTNVRDCWIEFCRRNSEAPFGFCQILGHTAPLAQLHPHRIRNAGDNAKLISANDETNFTFRGRFENSLQASGISIEATQKAHSALRWLLQKQGTHMDSQYLVAWGVDSEVDVPSTQQNTFQLCSLEDTLGMDTTPVGIGTAEQAAKKLNQLFAGYHAKLNKKQLCVILLDSATPGTMAIKAYRELEGWRYLDNMENWHKNCAWRQEFGKDCIFYGAPSPKDIVLAAYGSGVKTTDPRCRAAIERLHPCVWDNRPVPRDILSQILHRVSNPCVLEPWEFRKILGIACALYQYDHITERKYTMALEESLQNRDYLYGRLLAIADCLEAFALRLTGEARPTNAMRLMPQFVKQPYSTWNILTTKLNPYQKRLRASRPESFFFLETKLNEIYDLFRREDYVSDQALSGEYLMGYHCQKSALFTPRKEADADEQPENKEL